MPRLSPIAEKIPLSIFKSSLSSISFEMAMAIVVAARVSCSPGIHLKPDIAHHLCLFYAARKVWVKMLAAERRRFPAEINSGNGGRVRYRFELYLEIIIKAILRPAAHHSPLRRYEPLRRSQHHRQKSCHRLCCRYKEHSLLFQ